MNAVKSGNWDQVKAMIDGLYANHFNVQKVTPVIGRLLFANLASTLFKLLASLNVTYEELFGESRPLNPFQEGKSVEELHQSISSMFEALCRHVKEQRKDAAALMLSQIQQYIRDHYADPMISLVSIADHFQITSQYLSSFFKKHSGTNLTDFLAQVRIEQAKKLMENPSFTISQIASMVGYTNDVGFIRVFKKHEGITPGKYREIQQADLLQNAKNTNVYTNS
jgi:two-component system response regulator YesN